MVPHSRSATVKPHAHSTNQDANMNESLQNAPTEAPAGSRTRARSSPAAVQTFFDFGTPRLRFTVTGSADQRDCEASIRQKAVAKDPMLGDYWQPTPFYVGDPFSTSSEKPRPRRGSIVCAGNAMRFELLIGLRSLRARRRERFVSTIAMISLGGVAIGTLALT